jgi:hypothetical protein
MKKIIFVLSIAVNFAVGGVFASTIDVPPAIGGIVMNGIALAAPLFGFDACILRAGVYTEVWTGEVVKAFAAGLKDTFLDGVRDYSRYVTGDDEAQVIHSVYFGVTPDVLINNTTYPLPYQTLDGNDIAVGLDRYQTKATPVTADELHALSYDKIQTVKDAHAQALLLNRLKKAIHALAPASNDVKHPVLLTTGAAVGTRKRLQWSDVIAVRQAYADAGIPVEGLRFVLCPDHVNDLLLEDTAFTKSYVNFQGGVISSQLGFEFREYAFNPYYTVSTKAKLSFGAVPAATERQASVIFPVQKAGRAMGKTFMYYREAALDPEYQRNVVNFRNYFIAMPLITDGFAAVVSAIP